jgi:hypothetical protein
LSFRPLVGDDFEVIANLNKDYIVYPRYVIDKKQSIPKLKISLYSAKNNLVNEDMPVFENKKSIEDRYTFSIKNNTKRDIQISHIQVNKFDIYKSQTNSPFEFINKRLEGKKLINTTVNLCNKIQDGNITFYYKEYNTLSSRYGKFTFDWNIAESKYYEEGDFKVRFDRLKSLDGANGQVCINLYEKVDCPKKEDLPELNISGSRPAKNYLLKITNKTNADFQIADMLFNPNLFIKRGGGLSSTISQYECIGRAIIKNQTTQFYFSKLDKVNIDDPLTIYLKTKNTPLKPITLFLSETKERSYIDQKYKIKGKYSDQNYEGYEMIISELGQDAGL